MPLSDKMIRALCVPCEDNLYNLTAPPLIEQYSEAVDEPDKISYGLSSCGYDIRISGVQVKVFNPAYGEAVNPKKMKDPDYQDRCFIKRTFLNGEVIKIPANSYVLGVTVERFNIPRWLVGVCLGKSTYARVGILVNVTPLEPDWSGYLTVEVANTSPMPAEIYAGEGIAQILFHKIDGPVEKSYKDKRPGGGRYQNQEGVTVARV